jgi:hypothetical protein
MEASCSLQSELGAVLLDFLHLAVSVHIVLRIVVRVQP